MGLKRRKKWKLRKFNCNKLLFIIKQFFKSFDEKLILKSLSDSEFNQIY